MLGTVLGCPSRDGISPVSTPRPIAVRGDEVVLGGEGLHLTAENRRHELTNDFADPVQRARAAADKDAALLIAADSCCTLST